MTSFVLMSSKIKLAQWRDKTKALSKFVIVKQCMSRLIFMYIHSFCLLNKISYIQFIPLFSYYYLMYYFYIVLLFIYTYYSLEMQKTYDRHVY